MWRAGQTVSGPGGSIKYQFVYWNVVTVYMYYTTGWWLAFIFPYTYWECHQPSWRTHIFQRGRSSTNQILYSNIYIYIYYTIYVLYYNTLYVLYVPYIYLLSRWKPSKRPGAGSSLEPPRGTLEVVEDLWEFRPENMVVLCDLIEINRM